MLHPEYMARIMADKHNGIVVVGLPGRGKVHTLRQFLPEAKYFAYGNRAKATALFDFISEHSTRPIIIDDIQNEMSPENIHICVAAMDGDMSCHINNVYRAISYHGKLIFPVFKTIHLHHSILSRSLIVDFG